ncbi:MAG: TIGR02147 family protein [Bdellovibrionales bacterium]|nr:TIGR02147 family protein [Bdellovibrionales bacterium]
MAKQDDEVPQIKNYLSITSFLQDIYLYRKSLNAGFSYESWAAEIGFKSRSFLKMLIDGERAITAPTAETLCDAFSFSMEERSYFRLLVSYCQARDNEEKELYLEKIFENLGQHRDLTEIVHYNEFLSSKELPKLLVLLSFSDLDKSPAGLAGFLKQSVEHVDQNLAKLRKLELASVNATTGQWEPTKKNFKVPKSFSNRALTHYHNESLLEAIEAQKLPPHLRRFRSLLLPLEEEGFEKLLNDIESLISKSVAKYDSEKLEGKRLYKMNINLHPVTEKHAAHNSEHESTETCSQG